MDYLTVAANAARSQANDNRLNAAIEGFRQRTSSAALFPSIPSSVAVEAASPVVLDSLNPITLTQEAPIALTEGSGPAAPVIWLDCPCGRWLVQ